MNISKPQFESFIKRFIKKEPDVKITAPIKEKNESPNPINAYKGHRKAGRQ